MPESTDDLLRSVWEEIAPKLIRLITAMGIGRGYREDVLQDVYLAAWQKGAVDLDPVQLQRWLIRVTVNRCKLEHRHRSRWQAIWQGLAARSGRQSSGCGEAAVEEEHELVRRALAGLDREVRSLLVLRYFMEFDSEEIGRILEQPGSTIRGKLREARKQLAWDLKKAGFHYE